MGKYEERVQADIRYYEELLDLVKKHGRQELERASKFEKVKEFIEKNPRYLQNQEKGLVEVIIALKKYLRVFQAMKR